MTSILAESGALLISIKPNYAQMILEGHKTVELRRVAPRVFKGGKVLIYSTAPTKALVGAAQVREVIVGAPQRLWRGIGHECGLHYGRFRDYFSGCTTGYGIRFDKVWRLQKPLALSNIKRSWPTFHPPQGYWYLSTADKRCRLLFSLLDER